MTFSIYIDQLTLQHWESKIDIIDCVIVSFIADLNPENPRIRDRMWRGHFLIKRDWLIQELPMLGISEQTLYRRLRKLRELGIVSVLHKTVDGNKTLAYFKLSDAYWRVRTKRHKAAAQAAKDASGNEEKAIVTDDYGSPQSHSHSRSQPSSPVTSNESTKDSLPSALRPAASGAGRRRPSSSDPPRCPKHNERIVNGECAKCLREHIQAAGPASVDLSSEFMDLVAGAASKGGSAE